MDRVVSNGDVFALAKKFNAVSFKDTINGLEAQEITIFWNGLHTFFEYIKRHLALLSQVNDDDTVKMMCLDANISIPNKISQDSLIKIATNAELSVKDTLTLMTIFGN